MFISSWIKLTIKREEILFLHFRGPEFDANKKKLIIEKRFSIIDQNNWFTIQLIMVSYAYNSNTKPISKEPTSFLQGPTSTPLHSYTPCEFYCIHFGPWLLTCYGSLISTCEWEHSVSISFFLVDSHNGFAGQLR